MPDAGPERPAALAAQVCPSPLPPTLIDAPAAGTFVAAASRPGGTLLDTGAGLPAQPIGIAVAQVFGVDAAALDGGTRGRAEVALARQAAMYLAHVACEKTLTEVGRMFARDRTTVAHACAVIEDRRDDPMFDRVIELLELVVRALTAPRRVCQSYRG